MNHMIARTKLIACLAAFEVLLALLANGAHAGTNPAFRRPPRVVDANGKVLGTANLDGNINSQVIVTRRVEGNGFIQFVVDRSTGILPQGGSNLYFESADCSGQPYLPVTPASLFNTPTSGVLDQNGTLVALRYADPSATPQTRTVHSVASPSIPAPQCLLNPGGVPLPGDSCCFPLVPTPYTDTMVPPASFDTSGFVAPYSIK